MGGYDREMEQKESKTQSPGNRWWLAPALAALVLTLPVLYVLSVGPYVYLQTRGVIEPTSGIVKIYYPLQWAQVKYPPFLRLMNRYGRMWRYQPPIPPSPPPRAMSATSPSDGRRPGDIE
jgi:hypothetical protein